MVNKRKLLLTLGLVVTSTVANAETLVCIYPPSNYAIKNNTIDTRGSVVSITGDRFVFKAEDGQVITSTLTNCYIILQT